MSTEPELKPCPFCGKKAMWTPAGEVHAYAQVQCEDNGAGCSAEMLHITNAEAIAAWNRRYSDSEINRLRSKLSKAIEALETIDGAVCDDDGCHASIASAALKEIAAL